MSNLPANSGSDKYTTGGRRISFPLPVWAMVALLYLVLLLPPFAPFLFAGKTLYQGDIFLYFEPVLRYMSECARAGRLPLWNPLVCSGAPQIAVISPGLFYPLNYLFVILPFGQALAASLMLHMWIAGAGTCLLLRGLGRSASACVVGGAALMMSGYMFGSSQCYTLAATFAWTPLALNALGCIISSGSLFWAAALAVLWAMQVLAGRPEIFLSALTIYLGFALFVGCRYGRAAEAGELPPLNMRSWATRFMLAAVAILLGSAVASLVLVPVLELYSLSPRVSGLDYSEVARWSAGWFDWLGLVLTQPFGDLVISRYHINPHYPGLFPYISSLFLGAPVVTLAFIGFFSSRWHLFWFWSAVVLVFFLLSSGEFTAVLPALYKLTQSASVFRYPVKLAVFVLFALVLAAAGGWDAVAEGRSPRKTVIAGWLCWSVAFLAGAAIFFNAAGAADYLAGQILANKRAHIQQEMVAALKNAGFQLSLVACLGGFVLFLAHRLKKSPGRPILLAILAAVTLQPLMMNGPAYLWHMTDRSFYAETSPVAEWIKQQEKESGEPFRILSLFPDDIVTPPSWWRDDPLEHSVLLSQYQRKILDGDVNMNFALPSSYGFMPTDTRAFALLYAGVTARSSQYADARRLGSLSDVPLHRFCQVTATRYVLTLAHRAGKERRGIEPQPGLDPAWFDLVREMPEFRLRIHRVRNALPRAYFMERIKVVDSQVEALRWLFWADRNGFDPASFAVINSEGGRLPVPYRAEAAGAEAGYRPAKIISDSGEQVKVAVKNGGPGFLVVADTHYPGWRAYEGGRPLTVYQANGLVKAVFLAPGQHVVSFKYQPHSLAIGGLLALAGVSGVAALVAFGLISGRKHVR